MKNSYRKRSKAIMMQYSCREKQEALLEEKCNQKPFFGPKVKNICVTIVVLTLIVTLTRKL